MGMSRRIMGEGVRWRGQGGCRLEGRAHSEKRDLKVAISLAMHLREIGGDRSGGQAEVAGDDRKRSHAGHRAEVAGGRAEVARVVEVAQREALVHDLRLHVLLHQVLPVHLLEGEDLSRGGKQRKGCEGRQGAVRVQGGVGW